jgi:peptide/nickel transport system substrate-binding protein
VVARTDRASARIVTALLAAAFVHAACTPTLTPSTTLEPTAAATAAPSLAPTGSPTAHAGGTIYLLTQAEQWNQVDPQRIYTSEDLAFFGATIMRSLTAFQLSADARDGTALVPDMATDVGTATEGGRTWSFTLRTGVTWQDGSDVTCEDVKYGVSRTFATEMINQGPTYAMVYLDIPTNADGSSSYKGPYAQIHEDLYDRAVVCDGRTITFHLNRAVADFNYTTTLGFSPVPKAADTGETYGTTPDSLPISTGPYKVDSYTTGRGGRMVLSRNEHWNPDSDPFRKAFPDRWEVEFAIDPTVLDERIRQSTGNDATAVAYDALQPETVPTVFDDPSTPKPAFAARAVGGFDPYVRYLWINVERVTNTKIRQAMMVALDREAIRETYGGEFYGAFADGIVKPSIGRDYAPTGIWDDFFGQPVPSHGDPTLATRLIAESGETPRALKFKAPDTPTHQRIAKVIIDAFGRAGISAEFDPYCTGYGCGILFDRDDGDFGTAGWGADWPNASTVIPPLFTERGGWDLSMVDDPAFNAAIDDAFGTLDRSEQARKWQALNRQIVEQGWVIPTVFTRSYALAGTKVGPIYRWPAYNSWPYAEMFVTP